MKGKEPCAARSWVGWRESCTCRKLLWPHCLRCQGNVQASRWRSFLCPESDPVHNFRYGNWCCCWCWCYPLSAPYSSTFFCCYIYQDRGSCSCNLRFFFLYRTLEGRNRLRQICRSRIIIIFGSGIFLVEEAACGGKVLGWKKVALGRL